MNNTHIIFSEYVAGHILEYIHHVYKVAQGHDDKFIFILPKEFEKKKELLLWNNLSNVKFRYLTEEEESYCNKKSLICKAWYISKTVLKYLNEENADTIFLINLINVMPFIAFLVSKRIKISGILYKIYLYDNRRSIIKKIIDKFIYMQFSISKCFRDLYILNDNVIPLYLNKKYRTNRFKYLPDPIPNIDLTKIKDLRKEFDIPKTSTVYLQFGMLDQRKNTINILKAISLMSDDELKNKAFIFAGRLSPMIQLEFQCLVKKMRPRVQIIVLDGFMSYEMLNNLCYTSDIILTLYSNVAQSSGTIGYAAFFKKIVIGPSQGLLGKLIVNNKLGYVIDVISPKTIKDILLSDLKAMQNNYMEAHTVEMFCSQLFHSFDM